MLQHAKQCTKQRQQFYLGCLIILILFAGILLTVRFPRTTDQTSWKGTTLAFHQQ